MNKKNKIILIVFALAGLLWAWWMTQETSQSLSDQERQKITADVSNTEKSQDGNDQEESEISHSGKQAEEISSLDPGVRRHDQVGPGTALDSSVQDPPSGDGGNAAETDQSSLAPESHTLKGDRESLSQSTPVKEKSVSFPGIKQDMNDLMLSGLQYIPGEGEDSFVATFQLTRSGREFDGSAWVIGDYVQRGTKSLMSMPSHSGLNLTAKGTPKNPRAGIRLSMNNRPGKSLSKKFTVPRPGFEGEELSLVRVGIFDRKDGKLHVARVSAAQLTRKKTPRRARINGP